MKYKSLSAIILFFLALFFSNCSSDSKSTVETLYPENWLYVKQNKENWRKTYLPVSVQRELLKDTLLKDLFYRTNFLRQRWADSVNWTFKTNLFIPNKIFNKEHIWLVFDRIDTYGEVYLNDSLILKAGNYFKKWIVDIKKIVKHKDNELKIKLFSPFNVIKKIKKPYFLPYNGLEFVRKPFYQFDTSNAIIYTPIGLDDIKVIAWDKFLITDVWFYTLDIQTNKANIKAIVTVLSDDNYQDAKIIIKDKKHIYFKQKINLKKGENLLNFEFYVRNPKLWWTYDLGEPYVYELTTEISVNKKAQNSKTVNFGIRKIEIDTTDNLFTLKLNGKPLFLKIAEHKPLKIFPETITKLDLKKYFFRLTEAGVNMLYISRQGQYEQDLFYDLCDKNGILIWHDFMIPYDILPADNQLYTEIISEVKQQITRLRNHPSIAFWSVLNRFDKTLQKYGKKYTKKQLNEIKNFHNKLIHVGIYSIVKQNDTREFFPDMRFSSLIIIKDRMPAFPFITTLYSMAPSEELNLESEILKAHIKPANSLKNVLNNVKKISSVPEKTESLIYLSQLYTYYDYLERAEKFRLNNLVTGLIFSNFADYTPVVSPSAIDYFSYPKGKYYAIKKVFAPIHCKIESKEGWIKLNLLMETPEDVKSDIYFKLSNFEGKTLWRKNYPATVLKGNLQDNIFRFNLQKALKNKNEAVFKVEIYQNQDLAREEYFFFTGIKDLNLAQSPKITLDLLPIDNGYILELQTNYLAKDVMLATRINGIFSDNFLTIIPGETKKILFKTKERNLMPQDFLIIDYTRRFDTDLYFKQR